MTETGCTVDNTRTAVFRGYTSVPTFELVEVTSTCIRIGGDVAIDLHAALAELSLNVRPWYCHDDRHDTERSSYDHNCVLSLPHGLFFPCAPSLAWLKGVRKVICPQFIANALIIKTNWSQDLWSAVFRLGELTSPEFTIAVETVS